MDRLRRPLPALVACVELTITLSAQAPPAAPPDIDAWVARAMKTAD